MKKRLSLLMSVASLSRFSLASWLRVARLKRNGGGGLQLEVVDIGNYRPQAVETLIDLIRLRHCLSSMLVGSGGVLIGSRGVLIGRICPFLCGADAALGFFIDRLQIGAGVRD